ncbi:hypothetical protein [Roseateles amylovorans]|uniref:PRC-barrel domain containing protein n=1 Tax=Roseateles amylovorans TaxID=2978473 RepID=A0ABY6B366_9BURK|nr:hypothetical protein [Roseateles amylovorans]UXH79629.1 hypothetical protein N4261_06860 [Roseateles amylovorans]
MLNSLSALHRTKITGNDGDIGHVSQALFDDQAWRLRFLVVRTSPWLLGRRVLVVPSMLIQPITAGSMHLDLSRRVIRTGPTLHPLQEVTPQQTHAAMLHYEQVPSWPERAALYSDIDLQGFSVGSGQDFLGAVHDIVFDDTDWTLRYFMVDTSAWWQGGHRVLIGVRWTDGIDAAAKVIRVGLTRAQIQGSPSFQDVGSIDRDYEARLHRSYAQAGYWERLQAQT